MDLPTRPLTLPPTLPPRVSHPLLSSLAHPHFDKRDTEFIRRLRSNCLQAIFTLFAFITSLMSLIMGLLCRAAGCFSSRLPVFHWICFPPPQILFLQIFNIRLFMIIIFIFRCYYRCIRFDSVHICIYTAKIIDENAKTTLLLLL